MNFKEIDDTYVAHTYKRFPLLITSGKGSYVFDDTGKAYLDLTAGIGVNSLGYGYEPLIHGIEKQAEKLIHISNLFYNEPLLELAPKLVKRTHMKKVFFQNSGAEANEGAIKVAHKYANDHYHGQRDTILTLVNSFHGRTMETLMATGQDVFHHHFDPFPLGFDYIVANSIDSLHEKVNDHTAAIMMEMIQGEGGVNDLDKTFVTEVQKVCDEKDILLIIDEVQTGIGRTGTFFAYEQFGIHPDIVSFAKGIAGGIPMGGVLLSDKVENTLNYGEHGSTFAGNPLACAAANVVLDTITPTFLQNVKCKGKHLKARLEAIDKVKSVTGLGLMVGVELADGIQVQDVISKARENGVLFLTAKNKIRLLPPLTISRSEIDIAMDVLEKILEDM
ncbi:aspartate aminotransferase family protein [Absicoccus porci]|jgi:acetylornithine/N-succinyldiaminopimelate aminotransferase|uniref:aspartate aminotransferase family protein n=1 Tax=Absicoccus porci TaxID=2486576 RepID=UPI003D9417BC